MATTSSFRKPAVTSRSVSMPRAQADNNVGNYPDTTYPIENDIHHTPVTPYNNVARGGTRPSHGRSSSYNAQSFSARARDKPQIAQDMEALDQYTPPKETNTRANSMSLGRHPYSHGDPSPRSAQDTSQNTHQTFAHTDPSFQSQNSAQPSPAAQSSSRHSPRDKHSQQPWKKTRSPLTNLQATLQDISKEEKRAKVEEAEMLLRESQARLQSQNMKRDPQAASRDKGEGKGTQELEPSGPEADERTRGPGQNRLAPNQTRRQSQRQPSQDQEEAYYRGLKDDKGFDHGYSNNSASLSQPPRRGQHLMPSAMANPQPDSRYGDKEDSPVREPDNSLRDFSNTAPRKPIAHPARQDSQRRTSLAKDVLSTAPTGLDHSQKLQRQRDQGPHVEPVADHGNQYGRAPAEYVEHGSRSNPSYWQKTSQHPTDQRGSGSLGLDAEDPADFDERHGDRLQPDTSASPLQKDQGKGKQRLSSVSFAVPPPTPPPLSEWKHGVTCKLRATDFDLRDSHIDKAWWERGGSRRRRRSQKIEQEDILPRQKLGKNIPFNPPLQLKCGPLLRFTGMRYQKIDTPNGPVEQELWKGSIMIVTKDSASEYSSPPTLRLFSQPMTLLPPPPAVIEPDDDELAPEYVDPVAGVSKIGRNGKLLYVKPVDHIEQGLDLSHVEGEDGLFEESPSPLDYSASIHVNKPPDARLHGDDGEAVGKYKEVEGVRLYADPPRDVTFWRFNLEIELGARQQRIGYRINHGSAVGFWVPAKGQSMNMMFYSGNGFGISVDTDKYSGPDPMWRDVLNTHQTRPFHVMIGGGAQISSESVSYDTTHFQQWLDMKDKYAQYDHPLNLNIKAELESFYLEHYSKWFSQGLFGMANSQIPMVNMWNGHEIIAGFGSYSDESMSAPVFSGLGNIAFKYYLLFQHQTVPEETQADEPSWLLGLEPGPYIHQRSRNFFMDLGRRVSLLGIDSRTERSRDFVISDETNDHILEFCRREIEKRKTSHLLVLLPEPVASPRNGWLKNVLSSKAMEPVRALGRRGLFGGFGDNFEEEPGSPDDQWIAKVHKDERKWLIEDLQELAAHTSVRITILSGESHLAAIGQFYSNPKLQVPKDQDYRYIPNVISSAIVDAPVSEMMGNAINRGSKARMVDTNTVEEMRSIFTHDVEGKARSNKRLLPRRNWCSIREYLPGATPPRTPSEASLDEEPAPRPGGLMRSLSVSAGDRFKLGRRSSQRGPPPSRWPDMGGESQRRMSYDDTQRSNTESNFPQARSSTGDHASTPEASQDDPMPRPGNFVRRRTDLSSKDMKGASKGGPDLHHFINLRHGLDISLHCEVNPKDPTGITNPYRILIPALWFEGDFEPSEAEEKKRWWKFGSKKGEPVTMEYQPGNGRDVNNQEGFEEEGDYPDHPEADGDTPPPMSPNGNMPSMDSVPTKGYNGVEAYRPKKKWLGIF